jgi:archaellin
MNFNLRSGAAGRWQWLGTQGRLSAVVAAAVLVGAAGQARAAFVLDTGTPTGSSELILSTSASFAAEFSINAGETVTQLAAYLTPHTGNANSFELEIFSNATAFLGSAARSPTLVYSVTTPSTTPLASGWNYVTANWTAPATGQYWLAILEPNTGTTLDVQSESSTSTGTMPAAEFASTNTPGTRYSPSNTGIGLEITAVPLPAAAWLMLSGLGGLGVIARKRHKS